MKYNLISFFLFIIALTTKANDPVNGNYISLKDSYNFDFPQFDFSLKLPANAGFRVPFWGEKNAFLNINERNVSYCFNKNVISQGTYNFAFSLPKQNSKALTLSFDDATGIDIKENLKEIRKKRSYISDLPSLKSELGVYDGVLLEKNKQRTRAYCLQKGDLLITFIIYIEDEKEIKQCEKIIQSLYTADLKEKREEYLAMVKNGYFNKKEKTDTKVFISDTTQVKTVFSFSELGLKMSFPENWIYTFYGEKDKIAKKKDFLGIHWNVNDLVQSGDLYFGIYDRNVNVFTHFYPKTEKSNDVINRLIESQKLVKKFPVAIDGLETEAIAVGTASMPTIHFRLILNSYIFQLTVMSVTADNLSIVQSLISEIQISEEQKKGIPLASQNIKSIAEQLNIKEFKPGKLSNIELKQSASEIPVVKIPASFQDAGISFMIPKGAAIYASPEEYKIPDNKRIILKGKPDLKKGNLLISTPMNQNEDFISVALSFLNSELTFDNYFEMMVDSWKTYDMIKMKRTGFTVVNGQKWGIMEYSQMGQSALMIMTFQNDCIITVSYSGNNKEYKTLTEDMLFSFRFN